MASRKKTGTKSAPRTAAAKKSVKKPAAKAAKSTAAKAAKNAAAAKSTKKAAKTTAKAAKATAKAAKATAKAAKATAKAAKATAKAAKSTAKAAKTTAKAAKKPAATTSTRIASITPSKNGAHWTLVLESGAKATVASAPAQNAGVKVGATWSAAMAKRVLEADMELELFTRAMSMLAQDGHMGRAALTKELGGDRRAKATVASLAEHGWIH
ncbi:MAG: hypothetical protein ACOYMM_00745 [Phycisphaerales bacterium]